MLEPLFTSYLPAIYSEHLFDGNFGLERETLRIDQNGLLSQYKHPFDNDPSIDRDFCENQIEVITPVCDSIDSLYASLDSIDERVRDKITALGKGEYLWPFSNPPHIPDESIRTADYGSLMKEKEIYRNYLAEKYGKKRMLFCGVHYNFSYSDTWLKLAFEKSSFSDFSRFKNDIYLNLARKIYSYSWLIVYLTAASPAFEISPYNKAARKAFNGEASPRNGVNGYWNKFVPILDYADVKAYVESIDGYVKRGQLYSASECYIPVRVKPKGENTPDNLMATGIDHIELRMLDLNPLARLGVLKDDLRFIHLLLIYLTCLPLEKFGEFGGDAQRNAVSNHKNAAGFDCGKVLIDGAPLISAGIAVLNDMEQVFSNLGKKKEASVISATKMRLLYPELRYAQKIYHLYRDNYMERGLELSKHYSIRGALDLNMAELCRCVNC